MNEKSVKINLWVGFYSMIVLVISAIFIVLFLGKANIFQRSITLVVNFHNVEGLKVGSNVNLEGFVIGRVIDIHLSRDPKTGLPRHQVLLKIANKDQYLQWITDRSKFQIVNDNFFGDKHVDITFSSQGKRVTHLQVLNGIQTASINEILRNLQRITQNAESLLKKAGGVAGKLKGAGLVATLNDVTTTIQNVSSFSKKFRKFLDGSSSFRLERTLKNMDKTAANVSLITKRLDTLLKKDAVGISKSLGNAKKALANFEKISKTMEAQLGGKKGAAMLLQVRQAIGDFSSTSKNLAKLTNQMNKSLNSTSKQNVNLAKTLKDLSAGAENLRKITDRILNTMDAPNRFWNRIFRRGKKKKKGKKGK